MRTEKIATLVRAGILSLAIVIVLGKIWIPDRSGSRTASSIEITEFEDTSSLVAYPLPAPTAEPQEEPPPIEAISKPVEVKRARHSPKWMPTANESSPTLLSHSPSSK
jgi:hypothetical protein